MAQQEHGNCLAHHLAVPGPWDALWGRVLRPSLLEATLLPSNPVITRALRLTWVGLPLVPVVRWCGAVILTPPGGLPIQGCAVSYCLCRGVWNLGCYGPQCEDLEWGQSPDQRWSYFPARTCSYSLMTTLLPHLWAKMATSPAWAFLILRQAVLEKGGCLLCLTVHKQGLASSKGL